MIVILVSLFIIADYFPSTTTFYPLIVVKLLVVVVSLPYILNNRYFIPVSIIFLSLVVHPPTTPTMIVAITNWCFLLAVFVLASNYKIDTNKTVYLMPFVLLGLFIPTANTNIIAMNVYSLFFMKNNKTWWWYGLAILGLFFSKSEGAFISYAIAILSQSYFVFIPFAVGALVLLVVFAKILTPATTMVRLYLYAIAWFGFINSPFIGQGWGSYEVIYRGIRYVQPHNIVLDLMFSGGILWLSCFLLSLVWLYNNKDLFKNYQSFILCVLIHSLIDATIFGLPGLLLAVVLGQSIYNKKETLWIST